MLHAIQHRNAMRSQGYETMDLEAVQEDELGIINTEERKRAFRKNIRVWGILGALLVFLLVMTIVFTGKSSQPAKSDEASSLPPTVDGLPQGVVRKACSDSDALCVVVNPKPGLMYDYRNRSRMVQSSRGVVAADQSRCSDVGADVLKEGGTAVDAAVATALCQGVVNPFASGPGGGFFMLFHNGSSGETEFINAREVAPGNATQDMFTGLDPRASLDGGLAIGVSLELKGLELAWRRHGRLPWQRLVQPAADIAHHGYAMHPYLHLILSDPFIFNRTMSNPLMAEAFLKRGSSGQWLLPEVGEMCCRRPQLADTLNSVGREGVAWLYQAERLRTLAREIQDAGGIITEEDLKRAQPQVTPAMSFAMGEHHVAVPPPPSSGPVLALMLQILGGMDFPQGASDPASAAGRLAVHRMVEAMKHGFALRADLGDPGTAEQPYANVSALLQDVFGNNTFVEELRSMINDSSVLPPTAYGGRWSPMRNHSALYVPEDRGTSHICVVDAEGNAVSMTTTVNDVFGSNVVSPSTGLLWNNEMDDFSKPGAPNVYGLAPSVANFIAPFKRPMSSMVPTIITKAGKLRMVVGASGGPRIISATLQSIYRTLVLGQELLPAIMGARLHHQLLPPTDKLMYEDYDPLGMAFHVDNMTLQYLQGLGDVLQPRNTYLGDSQAVLISPQTTGIMLMTAVSDPRKDGAPAAV